MGYRDRTVSDKSGRTHDSRGKPYGNLQKAFNDIEETMAEKVFGKCTLFCGYVACSTGCASRSGG